MKKLSILSPLLLLALLANSQTTWVDVAPIFFKNCTSCHHKGGMAPFSLTTFAGAKVQAGDIDDNVTQRIMPPWPPDPSYSRLAHERILSQADIDKIHAWVIGGALPGDTANGPTPPTYDNSSALGTPDLTLTIPTYTVPGSQNNDIYQCFALPTGGVLKDKFITAMEIIPGNPAIVHHVLVYQDTSGIALQKDAAATGPGYAQFGGIGVNGAILLGGWVPGSQPYFLPANMGAKVYENSTIVLQIHYPNGSKNKSDSTKINLKLSSNITREVSFQSLLYHLFPSLQNGPLSIPANTTKTFVEKFNVPPHTDATVLSVGPHAHLLARQWKSFAVTPTDDTIPFIKINDWDFKWQGFYPFRSPVKIPGSSTLWATCLYDNTSDNPDNPNNPPKTVTLGEATDEEMMLVYFSYTLYQPGDENIVVDSSDLVDISTSIKEPADLIVSSPQLYDAAPNPANNSTIISYFLTSNAPAEIKIFDLQGKLVEVVKATHHVGFNRVEYNTTALNAGVYLYTLSTGGTVRSKQLVVAK